MNFYTARQCPLHSWLCLTCVGLVVGEREGLPLGMVVGRRDGRRLGARDGGREGVVVGRCSKGTSSAVDEHTRGPCMQHRIIRAWADPKEQPDGKSQVPIGNASPTTRYRYKPDLTAVGTSVGIWVGRCTGHETPEVSHDLRPPLTSTRVTHRLRLQTCSRRGWGVPDYFPSYNPSLRQSQSSDSPATYAYARTLVGLVVGSWEGRREGLVVGLAVGKRLGVTVGRRVGRVEGNCRTRGGTPTAPFSTPHTGGDTNSAIQRGVENSRNEPSASHTPRTGESSSSRRLARHTRGKTPAAGFSRGGRLV
jgi:hypothetical protein